MSGSGWLNDAQSYQNGDTVAFNGANDPSMSFMQTPSSSSFDFNSVQAQQLQQRMANGDMLGGPSAHPNNLYQTQPTIPSKRPRPQEESISGSPQPYAGAVPASRAQTPHGSYPGYSTPASGAAFPGGNPYQHMPQNANPQNQSPAPHNQSFHPPNAHQRIQTMSPSPYSPAGQNLGNHTSPSHSENGSRVNTPQNNSSHFHTGTPYTMATGQSFMPHGGPAMNGVPQPQYGQNQQHEQMMLETRARQVNQMAVARGGGHPQGAPFNPMGQPGSQMSNNQMAQIRAQQAQNSTQKHAHVQQTLQNYVAFARSKGLPVQTQVVICGKQHLTMNLFFGILKMGGSRPVNMGQQWPKVAQLLQYHQTQVMQAAQELQTFWQSHLAEFEAWYLHQQQQQQQHQQRQRAVGDPMRAGGNLQPSDPNLRQGSFSPPKPGLEQGPRYMQPPPNHAQNPARPQPSTQPNARNALVNGFTDPQRTPDSHPPQSLADPPRPDTMQSRLPAPLSYAKSRHPKTEDLNNQDRYEPRKEPLNEMYEPQANNLKLGPVDKGKADDPDRGTDMGAGAKPRYPTSHGGLNLDLGFTGNVGSLLKYKLRAPLLDELGPIYIHTLTLSLRSGICGEVRHALDTILSLSLEEVPLSLDLSDDLTEAIVECANDQVDLLAEHASEVSDAMDFNSYEDTVKGSKAEAEELQALADFGTMEHELETAVDKLICITTILRNFTYAETRDRRTGIPEPNSHQALSDPIVLKMLTTVIRYLGTRNMMLRTHRNALDFSKDVVVFLSEMAHQLEFQSKDDTLCALHFLLSFAPVPEPNDGDNDQTYFPSYTPSLNHYLPFAINALAKLLTRETNRTFCRSIFTTDGNASSYGLLTKAFGLAISPIPDLEALHDLVSKRTEARGKNLQAKDVFNLHGLSLIRSRAPFMIQGLLVAETLTSMIPISEREIAMSWLNSQDRFALRLMKTLSILYDSEGRFYGQQIQHSQTAPQIMDAHGFHMATYRGLTVLQKLIDLAKDSVNDSKRSLSGIIPTKQTIFEALQAKNMDITIVRKLCSLYALDN